MSRPAGMYISGSSVEAFIITIYKAQFTSTSMIMANNRFLTVLEGSKLLLITSARRIRNPITAANKKLGTRVLKELNAQSLNISLR